MKKFIKYLLIFIIVFELYSVFFSLNKIPPIQYVDRKSGEVKTEKVMAEKGLKWLYYDPFGKLTLNALIKRKFLSAIYGKKMDNPASAKKIIPFIKQLNLPMPKDIKKFHTFNEFFIREIPDLQKHINTDSLVISSPACGKVLAFENFDERSRFFIKGIGFSVDEFLNGEQFPEDAVLYIIRLTPADYHRFYFPYDCKVLKTYAVDGYLYSVSPIALRKNAKIFLENKRNITLCQNEKLGKFIMAEVGATFIGGIYQTFAGKFAHKGEEKGYFKFGGSSIVLIFQKDKIIVDKDILQNTKAGYETSIYVGESIGKIINE